MAQSVERRIGSAEVTGPIPVSSFFLFIETPCRYSSSVERQLPKLERRVRFPLSALYDALLTGVF